MIILLIESLCVIILCMILSTFFIDQRKNKKHQMRSVKLEGYWSGRDRRNAERLDIALSVKYQENGKVAGTKSLDISASGVRLLLDEKFEKGTPLRLEVALPNQARHIAARGEVVWTKELAKDKESSGKRLFSTGIKFLDFQKNDKKRLFDFINAVQKKTA